jgi:hypothetical protein
MEAGEVTSVHKIGKRAPVEECLMSLADHNIEELGLL